MSGNQPILLPTAMASNSTREDFQSLGSSTGKLIDTEKATTVSGTVEPVVYFEDPNLDRDAVTSEDDSPYPEVRSAVANTDDPDMPCNTLRAWTIGLIWAIILPGLNQFYYYRYPSVGVGVYVAILISLVIGRLWARVMPQVKVFGVSLNPGPFTIKEHVLISIMAGVASGAAYGIDVVVVQRVFYNQIFNFGFAWLMIMSTQLIGFSIGGILRRFLVYPAAMIWPANLVFCALFNTLHQHHAAGAGIRGGISRDRFFLYAFLGSFFWYFVPGYLFQALSYFTWVCWIAPNNVKVNQMFGYETGLGMSLITFDWAQITYIGSPLATPWWAEANVTIGFVFFFWFLVPILHFTNTWYSAFLPMSSRTSYDRYGNTYNVTAVLNPDATLNLAQYEAYSPLFLSTTFATTYGLSFASSTATIVHTLLYFRKQIWVQARRSIRDQPDIHARLMSRYREVPDWWYGILLLMMFVFGVVAIEVWPTQLPVWAFVLSLIIACIFCVPVGMILALTNQEIGLNVITELIIGYAVPGRPVAMMLFKVWGYMTMSQALNFASDIKLGHYMKVPPRPMFWAQVISTVIAGTVQLGVESWMFTHIEGMCTPTQKDGFICPASEVVGTASIIWGVIGPQRQFSSGQIYYGLLFFFLIGAVCPIIGYFIALRWPKSPIKYINFPVIFSGPGLIPPATAVNYVSWAVVGFVFNYVIRRRNFSWWTKYNFVLSSALDSGVAVSVIVIFFCLQYPRNGTIGMNTVQQWWGNKGAFNNADGLGTPLRVPPPEGFGPPTW